MSNAGNKARNVLILGATGSVGGALLRELALRGWHAAAIARETARLKPRLAGLPPVAVVSGDAEAANSVARAARGASVIVHAVNYPYHQWVPHMRRATEAVIAAAEANEATILFPGNVYGFGPPKGRDFAESDPPNPSTRKGRIRVELEALLADAAARGKARVLNLRAGDYFGPTVRNGLVNRIFGNAAQGKKMEIFGNPRIPHQWAYVPDYARMAVDLLEKRAALAPYEVVHMRGHVVESQRALCRLAAAASGHPKLGVRRIPWMAFRLLGLHDPVIHELLEMRYLFFESVVLDDPRRRALLPDFKETPLESAVATTVESYRA